MPFPALHPQRRKNALTRRMAVTRAKNAAKRIEAQMKGKVTA